MKVDDSNAWSKVNSSISKVSGVEGILELLVKWRTGVGGVFFSERAIDFQWTDIKSCVHQIPNFNCSTFVSCISFWMGKPLFVIKGARPTISLPDKERTGLFSVSSVFKTKNDRAKNSLNVVTYCLLLTGVTRMENSAGVSFNKSSVMYGSPN